MSGGTLFTGGHYSLRQRHHLRTPPQSGTTVPLHHLPLEADRIISGTAGVVAICVTQSPWPFSVPRSFSCSVMATFRTYRRNVPLLHTSRYVIPRDSVYQAFPRISTASDKRWGEKAWVRGYVALEISHMAQDLETDELVLDLLQDTANTLSWSLLLLCVYYTTIISACYV